MERWTLPHRERRRRHEAHPVLDSLFTYYSHRPAQLEQWHPGPGVALRDADAFLAVPGHVAGPTAPSRSTRPPCPTGTGRPPRSSAPCSSRPRPARRG